MLYNKVNVLTVDDIIILKREGIVSKNIWNFVNTVREHIMNWH